jgi:hypothetical protein
MAVTRSKRAAQSQKATAVLRRSARNKNVASGKQATGNAAPPKTTSNKSTGAKQTPQTARLVANKGTQRKSRRRLRSDSDVDPEHYYGAFNLQCPRVINKYLEVRETPTKGRGIFTRVATIPAGTLLLQEPVLLRHPHTDKDEAKHVRRLVSALKPEDHKKFAALSHHGEANTEEARYARNAFAAGKVGYVWFWISLINHECAPNSSMSYLVNGRRTIGNVRATKDIPEQGTEISIDYTDGGFGPWKVSQRRTRTQESWGFECGCAACRTPRITDRAIAEMFSIKAQLNFGGVDSPDPDNIAHRQLVDSNAGRLLELLKHWGRARNAYDLAHDVMDFYSEIEDDLGRAHTVTWALHAAKLGQCIWGLESLDDPKAMTLVTDVESSVAHDPRYICPHGHDNSSWKKVVRDLPQLMARQLYGNVREHTDAGKVISDIPDELY